MRRPSFSGRTNAWPGRSRHANRRSDEVLSVDEEYIQGEGRKAPVVAGSKGPVSREKLSPNCALQLCARVLDLARDAMGAAGLGGRGRPLEAGQRLVMVAAPGGNVSQPHQVRGAAVGSRPSTW